MKEINTNTRENKMSFFNLINEYVDDMNTAIQRFENTLGHGVRLVDRDVNETVHCTLYHSADLADNAYTKAVSDAKKVA